MGIGRATSLLLCLLLAGCHRATSRKPPPPEKGFVSLDLLASEHPLYPELARLQTAAERLESGEADVTTEDVTSPTRTNATPSLRAPRLPRAAAAQTTSPRPSPPAAEHVPPDRAAAPANAPPAARAALAEVDEEVERRATAANAAASAMAAEAAASHPPKLDAHRAAAEQAAKKSRDAAEQKRKDAAESLRAKRAELYQIILSETATACRKIALERGLDITTGSEQPPNAVDMTERLRPWLRQHWQEPRRALPSSATNAHTKT